MGDETIRYLVLKLYQSDHWDNLEPLRGLDIERLLPLLSDESTDIRAATAYTLDALCEGDGNISLPSIVGHALAALLSQETNPLVRKHTIKALRHADPATRDVALVTTFLLNEDYEALYSLQDSRDPSARVLLEQYLSHQQTEVCFRSAYALAQIYFTDTPYEQLLAWLTDQRSLYRLPSILALRNHKEAEAQGPLTTIASHDKAACARAAAIHALHLREDKTLFDPFLEALQDPDSKVRSQAAWAIRWRAKTLDIALQPEQYTAVILQLRDGLSDPDRAVREYAIDALRGGIPEMGVFDALSFTLSDPEPKVRRAGLFALGDYKDQKSKEVLQRFFDEQIEGTEDYNTVKFLLKGFHG